MNMVKSIDRNGVEDEIFSNIGQIKKREIKILIN